MGFFQWITEGVRCAVVRGIEEAAADINAGEGDMEITVRLPSYREVARLPHEEQPVQPVNGRRKKLVEA